MGQDATTTLSEIEAARQRLERDIDELDRRARPEHDLPEQAQRIGLAAVAAGTGVTVLAGIVRWRMHTRRQHRRARRQAELVADVLEDRDLVRRGALGLRPSGSDDDLAQEAVGGAALLAAVAVLGVIVGRLAGRRG